MSLSVVSRRALACDGCLEKRERYFLEFLPHHFLLLLLKYFRFPPSFLSQDFSDLTLHLQISNPLPPLNQAISSIFLLWLFRAYFELLP